MLIKSIVQAIPTYTMSCFRLPKSFCEDINRLCARFWLGSLEKKKKAHWMSWKRMCVSKFRGGMGFRDLNLFNQAMLAKKSLRIIKFSSSLLVRVLRGKYFKDGNFLMAREGSNPSFTWRSILCGRSLFKEGMRWKIEDGKRVYIDQDPWIANNNNKILVWVKDELRGRRVIELLDDQGQWKENVSWKVFSPMRPKKS